MSGIMLGAARKLAGCPEGPSGYQKTCSEKYELEPRHALSFGLFLMRRKTSAVPNGSISKYNSFGMP
jgi:hypothetical protein